VVQLASCCGLGESKFSNVECFVCQDLKLQLGKERARSPTLAELNEQVQQETR
jgi:hypothetical protein